MPESKDRFLLLMAYQGFYDGDLDGPFVWYSTMVISSIFIPTLGEYIVVEFFEGWKPLSPLQLAMEEVMSE
ncbi:hypothetical protein Tco_0523469 [Tanacetum coccineum]